MSDNPYQAPAEEPPEDKQESVKQQKLAFQLDLKTIIKHQKGVVACLCVYLLFLIGPFLSPSEGKLFSVFMLMVVAVMAAAYAFPLETLLFNRSVAILLTLLTLLPGVGLLILLTVAHQTTKFLRSKGIHAGLFGANLSDVEARPIAQSEELSSSFE